MKGKRCAYCGKEVQGTREHIISSSVLDLFPECFLTIDEGRKIIHEADPVICDVCADCNNNKISYIDGYAKTIIAKYFMKKHHEDETVDFEYDYTMIQKILLKYAYNDLRAHKENIEFYDDEILSFLKIKEDSIPKKNIIVLAGLAINTSPVPDYVFGNQKLQWLRNPLMLRNSIIMNIDYNTGGIKIREPMEVEKFEYLNFSYVFRFNSVQFLILCFNKNIPESKLKEINIVLSVQYPYQVLGEENKSILSRCTGEITYHRIGLIDVSWGQGMFDEISIMREMAAPESRKYFEEITKKWDEYEKELADKHKR